MNQDIINIRKSIVRAIKDEARALKAQGTDIISLASGEPDFDTPKLIRDVAIENIQKGNTHYAPGKGLLKLRKAICQKLESDNHIVTDEENIIVTYGAKMAVYLAVRTCVSKGDEVIILSPSWVSYAEIVRASGGVPISLMLDDSDNYVLTYEKLKAHTSNKTRMLIVCTPNNPTGRILDLNEINAIERFANENDVIVLSDEVYEKIVYSEKEVISPGSLEGLKDRTITVNGFSKTYAMTGWRLGYLAGPSSLVALINKLHIHTHTGTSPFIQEAATAAFLCNKEVEKMRKQYELRREVFLSKIKNTPHLYVFTPEGAFYAWVRFDIPGMNSIQFAQWLLNEAHVLGIPGRAYGDECDNYIRFSIASSLESLNEASDRISNLLKNYDSIHSNMK
jgi:aspartate aminotransferase